MSERDTDIPVRVSLLESELRKLRDRIERLENPQPQTLGQAASQSWMSDFNDATPLVDDAESE